MKLLTVNMYMTDVGRFPERLEELGKLIVAKRPEFVALQTVNSDAVKKIKSSMWGSRYNVITPPTTYANRGKPTCAILSTYPPFKNDVMYYRDPDSPRHLLTAYFTMFDKQKQQFVITVSTSHLEVGAEVETSLVREKQLNQALSFLSDEQDCILLGDLSLIDAVDGELVMKQWKDAWLSLPDKSPDDDGDTFVPAENSLIKSKALPSYRPDRVIFKTLRLKLESVEVVGKDAFNGVPVSSHFPLMATLQILDNASFSSPTTSPDVPCVFKRS